MAERDAFGPGSGGVSPGQADGEDGQSEGGLAAVGDGLAGVDGSVMAGDVVGDGGGADGGDESVAHDPNVYDGDAVAGLDDAFGGGDSGVADLYELRLTALLHQLVRRRGHKGAARELGVNPRTVAASVKQGMSRRVREALERMLVDRDGEARDRLEDEMDGVKVEVAGVRERVAGLEGGLREGLQALGEQQAQGMRRLERRLAQAESGKGGGDGAGPAPRSVPAPGAGSSTRRRYPDLVTRDPDADDEEVYGGAWPLVDEWRRLWDGHPAQGKGLAWVSRRERILELEVAMLEDHGLTLPPETEPLRGLDRGAQLNWRLKALHEFNKRRARLELLCRLRLVFTLGLWRK